MVLSLEIEVETWTSENEIKKKKDNSFHLHQTLQQILQKNIPKHLPAKEERIQRASKNLREKKLNLKIQKNEFQQSQGKS